MISPPASSKDSRSLNIIISVLTIVTTKKRKILFLSQIGQCWLERYVVYLGLTYPSSSMEAPCLVLVLGQHLLVDVGTLLRGLKISLDLAELGEIEGSDLLCPLNLLLVALHLVLQLVPPPAPASARGSHDPPPERM